MDFKSYSKVFLIPRIFNVVVIFAFAVLTSCKAVEAPNTGFVKAPEKMHKDPTLPFQKVWFYKHLNLMNYNKIIINPVTLRYLLNQSQVESMNVRKYLQAKDKDDRYVANYFRNTFLNAFKSMHGNRFKIVKHREYGTLILDIAIVEIVPTKVSVNSEHLTSIF